MNTLFFQKARILVTALVLGCALAPFTPSVRPGLESAYADPAETPTPTACAAGTPIPLTVGQLAIVAPGPSMNLRQSPTKTARRVAQLRGDTPISLLVGPNCAEGLNWWQVTDGKVTGWLAEGSGKQVYIVTVTSDPSTVFHDDGTFPAMPIAFRNVRMTYNGIFGKSVTLDISDTLTPNDTSESPLYGARYIGFSFKEADVAYFWIFPTPDVEIATGASTPAPTAAVQSTPTICPDRGKKPSDMTTANGAITLLRAKTHTMRFSNNGGEVIRQVEFEAQAYGPPTASSLRYVFQGLTDDGCYYVYGYFSITVSFLPTDYSKGDPAFQAAADAQDSVSGGAMSPRMAAYYDSVRAKIDAQPDSAFSPRLDQIDALIRSIIIN